MHTTIFSNKAWPSLNLCIYFDRDRYTSLNLLCYINDYTNLRYLSPLTYSCPNLVNLVFLLFLIVVKWTEEYLRRSSLYPPKITPEPNPFLNLSHITFLLSISQQLLLPYLILNSILYRIPVYAINLLKPTKPSVLLLPNVENEKRQLSTKFLLSKVGQSIEKLRKNNVIKVQLIYLLHLLEASYSNLDSNLSIDAFERVYSKGKWHEKQTKQKFLLLEI